MTTCEDEVSEKLFEYFELESLLRVKHYHPPGGKKYLTPHLRIPIFAGATRKGRKLIDLVLVNTELLVLVECKCYSSESSADVKKLRDIRDKIGLQALKTYFGRQGVDISHAKYLVLGLGIREVDATTPDEFAIFIAPLIGVPIARFGPKVGPIERALLKSLLPQK